MSRASRTREDRLLRLVVIFVCHLNDIITLNIKYLGFSSCVFTSSWGFFMSTMTETPSSMMMTADGKNVLSSSVAVVTSSSSSSSLFMKEDYVSSSSHQSTSPKEYFYNALALVALGTSIAAFIMIEGGWIVNIVSVICAFLGPVAALQQQRLTDFQSELLSFCFM
jgi:hypothetical protein